MSCDNILQHDWTALYSATGQGLNIQLTKSALCFTVGGCLHKNANALSLMDCDRQCLGSHRLWPVQLVVTAGSPARGGILTLHP